MTERELVDAELADLASSSRRDRDAFDFEPADAPQRTGRRDRDRHDPSTATDRRRPAVAGADQPRRPAVARRRLAGAVRRGARVGEFTELIIPGQGVPGRPTVQIRGRGTEGRVDALLPDRARRRPSRTVSERLGPRPDRVALWALVLAVVLIITAVATADASTLTY